MAGGSEEGSSPGAPGGGKSDMMEESGGTLEQ